MENTNTAVKALKRNMFIVGRNGGAGVVSHDPRTGKCKKQQYDTSEAQNDVLGTMNVVTTVLRTIAGSEPLKNGAVTLYTLDNVAIPAFECVKHLREANGDVVAAQQALIDSMTARLEGVSDEQLATTGDLLAALADAPRVQIRKISNLRAVSRENLYGAQMKELVNHAWNLCPVAALAFEDDAEEASDEAMAAEIEF